jgi:hypothetical protein
MNKVQSYKHCKKGYQFSRPQPARESLVSDTLAGDMKNDNLFYSVGRIWRKRKPLMNGRFGLSQVLMNVPMYF